MSPKQKTALIIIGIIVAVILIPYVYLKSTYNTLVTMDESVKAAWAQVENQLQRRTDLIPNLVETVKGFASQEKDVFIKVTEARSRVAGAGSISEKIAANNQLTSALSRLLVVVERYPELKSNANFMRLQDELAGTENRIAVERMRFNEAVRAYNTKIRSFPTNIIAGMFGFKEATFFEVPKEAQGVPKVKFNQ
jgi:LemA protein